jgi:hypothetical protein
MATAIAVIVPFFFLGNPSGHDFEFHVLSWVEVVAQWKQGIWFPRWAVWAHWTYGEARFLFYPPASWKLGALLGSLLPWKMVPGAFVWCALSASGCAMFLLGRTWLVREDAIFAAALYTANPYYFVVVYWRSALAELLAGCLLPLLVLWVLRAERESSRVVVPLGLIVAAAWLINVPTAVMVTYSLTLLFMIVAAEQRRPRLLWYGAAAVLVGVALASFYLIPAAYEQSWVRVGDALSAGFRPQDNFFFAHTGDGDHDRFNLLVSIVGMAELTAFALALYFLKRWREQPRVVCLTISIWTGASALLLFPFSQWLWRLPELRFVQFPWRWLLCLNVGFALLVTVAFRRWVSRFVLCLAMLCVVFAVWHRIQAPWWDTAADIQELHDFIEDGTGYEGTDEYVPTGADPGKINKRAPKVAVAGRGTANIRILKWDPEAKRFTAEVARPERLRLRLFNYPAWRVEVNGLPISAKSQPTTGEIVVPVETGISEVRVKFVRTKDRLLGAWISIGALGCVAAWFISEKRKLRHPI